MTNDHKGEPPAAPENSLGDIMESALDEMELASHGMIGVPTGFADLDALTGGLRRGHLTVLASRPGIGRSTLLRDFCRAAAIKHGLPTSVFTLEESREEFAQRLLSAEARVATHYLRLGRMTDDDWTRCARRMPDVSAAPLFIHSPASLTVAELAAQAREDAEKHGIRLIAVDGIQDIQPEKRNDLREREVGDNVRALKTLARELDVPIVATSHLNRGPEQRYDKRPALDDLRESGAVTYSADLIVLLFREDAYEKESPRAGEADFIVAKSRFGPTATITVAFQGHYSRFVDMAPA